MTLTSTSPPVAKQWALVTGASAGIGRAIALELAHRGHPLILVARDEQRLNELAAIVKEQLRVPTQVLPCDLCDPAARDALAEKIQKLPEPVSILVNNAGFAVHGSFATTPLVEERRLVHLQLGATLLLTKTVLPAMIRQKFGHVLNIASVYSFSAVPQQAVYAACKSFMMSFTQSLRAELAGTGVNASVSCPGVTYTEFRSRAGLREKKSLLGLSAEYVAQVSVNGMMRRRAIIVPGRLNNLYAFVSRLLPPHWMTALTAFVNRRRALKSTHS